MRGSWPLCRIVLGALAAALFLSPAPLAEAKAKRAASVPAAAAAAPIPVPAPVGSPPGAAPQAGGSASEGAAAPPAAVAEPAPAGQPSSATEPGPAAEAGTFESLVSAAVPMADLGTLMAPFAGKCDGEKRELDRIRCRTTRAYLRKAIPRRSFSAIVEDPAAISVSEYDASIKGYHLSVAGCLACTRPISIGRSKEARLITLKVPEKAASSLRAAVEVSRNSAGFDSLNEAKTWMDQSRPELRTQFVFQPAETEWSFGSNRGYAMRLLGFRVFNRCTGEILISRPPSTDAADVAELAEGCRRQDRTGEAQAAQGRSVPAGTPAELSKNDISQTMSTLRPQIFACFEKFKVPGMAQLDFVVGGTGTVNSVRLSGAFFGTPTGDCVLEAAKAAHFRVFSADHQQFAYPFFLRQ